MTGARRILLTEQPFGDLETTAARTPWAPTDDWPAHWVRVSEQPDAPFVAAYRCRFACAQSVAARIHVSADERYDLWLDGRRVGRGPERGDKWHWFFETYELDLSQGDHVLVARVWSLGDMAPWAQVSLGHAFICAADEPQWNGALGTGEAPWEGKVLGGYSFEHSAEQMGRRTSGIGAMEVVDGAAYDWGWESGGGENWRAVEVCGAGNRGFSLYVYRPDRWLRPAVLPPMLEAKWRRATCVHADAEVKPRSVYHPERNRADLVDGWNRLLREGTRLRVPPHARQRLLFFLGDYLCAYPEIIVGGGRGARMDWRWAEALVRDVDGRPTKDDRGAFADRYVIGYGDAQVFDGGERRRYSPLWWRCGLWVELRVTTADDPLVVESLRLVETRYPHRADGRVESGDADLQRVFEICRRCQQSCAHETYMDGPHYEQLMYAGDARVHALQDYVTTLDAALQRKALRMFDSSRTNPTGLTTSNHPARAGQMIPTFSLIWVGMIRDFALWRDDAATVRSLLPGMRGVLEAWFRQIGDDGLAVSPAGWNFIEGGTFPGCREGGVSASLNWFFAHALADAAALEEAFGEPEYAARCRRALERWHQGMDGRFWNAERGLYADDDEHTFYSQHAQCLAVLHEGLDPDRRERIARAVFGGADDLQKASAYFFHYLFAAAFRAGYPRAVIERLEDWKRCVAQGFRTTPEYFGTTRSDCHAWSAHPLYHAVTGFMGVRPRDWGFRSVQIAPADDIPRGLTVEVPHRVGTIGVSSSDDGEQLAIRLPTGLKCAFTYGGETTELEGDGETTVRPLHA